MAPQGDTFPPRHTPWRTVRSMLRQAGMEPRKRYGQNFLTDARVLDAIQHAVMIRPPRVILEIGPGPGVLTERLLACAPVVIAVEIDGDMADFVRERFADSPGLHVIHADILSGKNRLNPEILNSVLSQEADDPDAAGGYQIVANLPYNIGTPMVAEFMALPPEEQPERMLVMLQKELADRILAKPGSRDFGPLAVVRSLFGTGRLVRRVSPGAFWPAPKVDSAVIDLIRDPGSAIPLDGLDRRQLIRFVRDCFAHRRQTARRVLRDMGYPASRIDVAFSAAGIDGKARFEDIPAADIITCRRALGDRKTPPA